jgi:hypothetical protein
LIPKAIAFFELQKPKHELLIQESVELSRTLAAEFSDVPTAELAVEVAVCFSLFKDSIQI